MRNRFIKSPSRNHEYKNVNIYNYIKPVIQYYAHEFEYSRIYIYIYLTIVLIGEMYEKERVLFKMLTMSVHY
jgi:hypothetical protein